MPNRLLPREGFHGDVLGSIIKQTLLNPLLTVPLLALAKYHPDGPRVSAPYPRLLRALYALSALGTARVLNNILSRRALNNGVTDNTYDWAGREVVVVTGGSDGIGARIVHFLSERGVKVAILDIQDPTFPLQKNTRFYRCDITKQDSIEKAAAAIRADLGQVTVLVNNAGVCRGKTLLESTARDVALTFDVNTVSHYTLARTFLPHMVSTNHGMVVTVASSAAWVTAPRMTEYAASKAAAMAFHEGLAAELVAVHDAPRVRTVLVNQGYTQTSLFRGFAVTSSQFLGPALHVDTVAEAITDKIFSGESGQIIVPGFYKLLAQHWRSLPDWMAHGGRVGMVKLMQKWHGRIVPTEETQ